MKLEILNCPKCGRKTIQGKTNVPTWKHGAAQQSLFTTNVTVCSVCGFYIHRERVWQEKCGDPQNYDF